MKKAEPIYIDLWRQGLRCTAERDKERARSRDRETAEFIIHEVLKGLAVIIFAGFLLGLLFL